MATAKETAANVKAEGQEAIGETVSTVGRDVATIPVLQSGFVRPTAPLATRQAELERSSRIGSIQPDHSGIAKAKEEKAKSQEDRKNNRRERLKSGTLGGGTWKQVGNSLVNTDALFKVDVPTEDDATKTLTLTSVGGAVVTVTGEDAAELMEELGLKPLPSRTVVDNRAGTVREDGRITSEADEKAAQIPGRENRVPNRTHFPPVNPTSPLPPAGVPGVRPPVAAEPVASVPPGEDADTDIEDADDDSETDEIPAMVRKTQTSKTQTPKKGGSAKRR